MKKIFLILVVIFVSSIYAVAFELPTEIKSHLDKNYPGWKLVDVCYETDKLPIVEADLDGNQKQDYALAIKTKNGKIYVFAFLKQDDGFQAFLLRNPKGMKISLSVVKKGELVPLSHQAHEPLKLKNDGILLEDCEFLEEGGTFYFNNDKFELVSPLS